MEVILEANTDRKKCVKFM